MESYGIVSRSVAVVVLLFGTFFAGTLPIFILKKVGKKISSKEDREHISGSRSISFLMCFGGGVLFATCFVHLLPEVRENFESYEHSQNNSSHDDEEGDDQHSGAHEHKHEFPLPEFLICAGFLAVYFVEEVLHAAIGHTHGPREGPESHGHTHSPVVLTCYNRDAETDPGFKSSGSFKKAIKGDAMYGSTDNHLTPPVSTVFQHGHGHFEADTVGLQKKEVAETNLGDSPSSHGHSHGLVTSGEAVNISLGGLLIVVALSFHSIFEGLAIGLQKTNRDVWTMLIAVSIHKFVIAFVVGLEVCAEGSRRAVLVIYMVVFSLMSPIGIIIGMLSEMSLVGTWDIAIGYLNALATGTLLYVTFFEVLQREKNSRLLGIYQFFAVTIGFGFMATVSYFAE